MVRGKHFSVGNHDSNSESDFFFSKKSFSKPYHENCVSYLMEIRDSFK